MSGRKKIMAMLAVLLLSSSLVFTPGCDVGRFVLAGLSGIPVTGFGLPVTSFAFPVTGFPQPVIPGFNTVQTSPFSSMQNPQVGGTFTSNLPGMTVPLNPIPSTGFINGPSDIGSTTGFTSDLGSTGMTTGFDTGTPGIDLGLGTGFGPSSAVGQTTIPGQNF